MYRSTFQKQSTDAKISLNIPYFVEAQPFLQTDANLRNFSLANLDTYYILESLKKKKKLFLSMRKGET